MNILRKERILSRFAFRMTGYLVVVNAARRAAIRFSFKGITDSFALRVQNDRSFSYCERRKACGNPFPPSKSYKQKKTACQAVF